MDSRGHVVILATIFLSLFLHFPSQIQATNPILDKLLEIACSQCDDPKVCVGTLLSHPKILIATNLKAVAQVALGIAKKEALSIRDLFDGLVKVKNYAAFKRCASYFNEGASQLNLRGLREKTASLDMHYALDDAVSCECALAEEKIEDKLILGIIKKWKHLYSIAASAVSACEDSE